MAVSLLLATPAFSQSLKVTMREGFLAAVTLCRQETATALSRTPQEQAAENSGDATPNPGDNTGDYDPQGFSFGVGEQNAVTYIDLIDDNIEEDTEELYIQFPVTEVSPSSVTVTICDDDRVDPACTGSLANNARIGCAGGGGGTPPPPTSTGGGGQTGGGGRSGTRDPAPQALPQFAWESPPAHQGFVSGKTVISGWVCDARRVDIWMRPAGTPDWPQELRFRAALGTARADTAETCGDTDNGFGLLFNWNILGDGDVEVWIGYDGVGQERRTVTVTTFGEEFLRDAPQQRYTLDDFPAPGESTSIQWDESLQNFVIVGD